MNEESEVMDTILDKLRNAITEVKLEKPAKDEKSYADLSLEERIALQKAQAKKHFDDMMKVYHRNRN